MSQLLFVNWAMPSTSPASAAWPHVGCFNQRQKSHIAPRPKAVQATSLVMSSAWARMLGSKHQMTRVTSPAPVDRHSSRA